jgi:flagellar export protein FliJ
MSEMTSGKAARFNTIITVREHQKRQTTKELGQIRHQKKHEQEKLSGMHEEHTEAMTSATERKVTASEVQAKSAFIKRLAGEISRQSKKIEKIEGQEETKRVELLERVKAKSVIEKLQDNLKKEIQKESDAKEQTLLDSVGQRSVDSTI